MVVLVLALLLALPSGSEVVEAPLASHPPRMDNAVHGYMPAPDFDHIPDAMLPTPGFETHQMC